VGESANQRDIVRASRTGAFIAADVGGTHARIGLVHRPPGAETIDVLRYERYACADWPSLTAVLQDFIGRLDARDAIEHCAVANAGYVLGDAIVNENLPWPVSIGDIRDTGVEILTIGQYLQPTTKHLPVDRFVHPDEFAAYRAHALALGFAHCESGPLVRSSYHAHEHVASASSGVATAAVG